MQTNADHDDLHYKDYTRALSLLLNWVVIGGDSRAPPSTPTPPAPPSSARACVCARACVQNAEHRLHDIAFFATQASFHVQRACIQWHSI